MLVYVTDSDPTELKSLHQTISEALPDAAICDFAHFEEVLETAQRKKIMPDAVFAAIRNENAEELSFAERLKSICSRTRVIFTAGTDAWAAKAYAIHAEGYVIRPFSKERIWEEAALLHSCSSKDGNEKIKVRCFGTFAVFWQDKPLVFNRKKTMELLAFLVQQWGAPCSAEEAIDVLFEEAEPGSIDKAKQNLRNLVFDLTSTLRRIGQEDILIRTRNSIAIRPDWLDCDYYRMLAGDPSAEKEFRGEYMKQYTWAEDVKGALTFRNETYF